MSDTQQNRRILEKVMKKIDAEITLGTFDYAKTFPNSKRAIKFVTAEPTPAGKVAAGVLPSGVVTPLFKEFSLEWYEEREVGWKRSYREKLMDMLNLFLHPAFGEKRVSDITKADILKFRASLAKVEPGKEKGRSASRINQVTNLLKQIVDEAADRYDFNTPYRGIKPLRIGRTEVDPFSLEEVPVP